MNTIDLDDIYIDGHAISDAVPPGCPILRGGGQSAALPALVTVVNREMGTDLPTTDIVTPELLQTLRSMRARVGWPVENFGYTDEPEAIGPNTWAAIKALSDAHASPKPAPAEPAE